MGFIEICLDGMSFGDILALIARGILDSGGKTRRVLVILCFLAMLGGTAAGETTSNYPPEVYGLRIGTPKEKVLQQFWQKNIKMTSTSKLKVVFKQAPKEVADLQNCELFFDDISVLRAVNLNLRTFDADSSLDNLLERYNRIKHDLTDQFGTPDVESNWMLPDYEKSNRRLAGLIEGGGWYGTVWNITPSEQEVAATASADSGLTDSLKIWLSLSGTDYGVRMFAFCGYASFCSSILQEESDRSLEKFQDFLIKKMKEDQKKYGTKIIKKR